MEEESIGSPRWITRSRDRANSSRTGDRLKPLSPTRHHRSTDELRQGSIDESQTRHHLERLDSQVSDLNSHVSNLTTEVGH